MLYQKAFVGITGRGDFLWRILKRDLCQRVSFVGNEIIVLERVCLGGLFVIILQVRVPFKLNFSVFHKLPIAIVNNYVRRTLLVPFSQKFIQTFVDYYQFRVIKLELLFVNGVQGMSHQKGVFLVFKVVCLELVLKHSSTTLRLLKTHQQLLLVEHFWGKSLLGHH